MPKKTNESAKALRVLASMNRNLTCIAESLDRIERRQIESQAERIREKKNARNVAAVAFETIGKIAPELAAKIAPVVKALREENP